MKRLSIGLLLVLVALMAINCKDKPQQPTQNTAKVIFLIGDVQVKESDNWVTAIENMILYQGNEIKTGDMAQCNIVIGDNSFISIKEKSHLLLESLYKDINGNENNSLNLQVGKSVINPKKLLKGEEFQVKTPTAIAAVRGTKFVVESHPAGKMKVAVVDGKVELQRRIPALEEVEEKIITRSVALAGLKEKVELEKLVVDANESAFIDNKKAERENKAIEKIILKHVEEIKEVEAIEKEKPEKESMVTALEEKKTRANEVLKTKDLVVKDQLSSFLIMKKEKDEVVQIKVEKQVEVEDVKAIKELDSVIEEVKEKEQKQEPVAQVEQVEPKAELVITSPIKKSVIYINDKFVGHDLIRLNPEPDETIAVRITAEGYEDYIKSFKLRKAEKKTVTVEFVESPRVTIVSPVKNSSIFVDSKYVGRDEVTVPIKAGTKATVSVRARGFKSFTAEVPELKVKQTISITADMERIVALDRVKWSRNIKADLSLKPVYHSGLIIIATNNGTLVAMNKAGNKLWEIDLKRRIESTPLASKGNVYVITNSGDFYSLAVSTGAINWKKKVEGSLLFGSRPVLDKSNIYLATSYGKVYAMNLNGNVIWQKDLENGIYSSPVVDKGILYVGAEDQNVYALSTAKGSINWIFQVDGRMVSSAPVVEGKTLYVGCYSGSLYAIDIVRGKQLWKFSAGDSILSTPIACQNGLCFGSNDGNVYSLSLDSGKVLWKYHTGNKVFAQPEVSGSTVFITSGSSLYALDASSGTEQWSHAFSKAVKTSATVLGNDIIVGIDGGEVASVRNSLTKFYE